MHHTPRYLPLLLAVSTACDPSGLWRSHELDTSRSTSPEPTQEESESIEFREDLDGYGRAMGLELHGLASFQNVKVDLAEEGRATFRNAPIVAGRDAIIRAYVRPIRGERAGDVTALLEVRTESGVYEFQDVKRITSESTDASSESLFEFELPGDLVTGDAELRVSLWSPEGGGDSRSMLPSEAGESIALAAMPATTLNVVVVPLRYTADRSARLPDTGTGAMDALRAHLLAIYPVRDVNVRVREAVDLDSRLTPSIPSWDAGLRLVARTRAADNAPDSAYYIGMVRPAETFEEYCRGRCTGGLAFTNLSDIPSFRAAIVTGWSSEHHRNIALHELGHNLGQLHSPCTTGDAPWEVDRDYPQADGSTGVWGYDSRERRFIEPSAADIMGYCGSPWISDFTAGSVYDRLLSDVDTALNASVAMPHWMVSLARFQRPTWDRVFVRSDAEGAILLHAYDADGRPLGPVLAQRAARTSGTGETYLIPDVAEAAVYELADGTRLSIPGNVR